ncbi:GNAT family N-acetyltransferase [Ancylobacter radicis]|uniref:L-ornithine N(alpha)-acyltransferase n=1 Tax=Ancylobacter radicis TaxID=2836179 RepID=A0ABS5RAU4_9HYPH|nr:GNAT family N-acyltransferase [Ancylobacter radicis]MBS9477447.1 GNAT family N-acetyltransferase [Ancylobacter radicis]
MTEMLADANVEAVPATASSVFRAFLKPGLLPPALLKPFTPKTARPASPAPSRFSPAAFAPSRLMPALRSYSGLRHRESRAPTGPSTLGRIGALEVRLAVTAADVRRAQRLRYEVFYEEMSAIPAAAARIARRDFDQFDAICDHLLVLDHDNCRVVRGRREPRVVGTYRLLRQSMAERHGGFYTASEFDIGPLLARHPGRRFLELGRSCVLRPYRTKRTVELLWHGIWAYVRRHGIDVMFGCASLEGTDPQALARPLAFLHHFAPVDPEWSADALPRHAAAMDRLPVEALDAKAALNDLPPLIKGYLRLGAQIGRGAVVDHQFGTTDVLIVLPVERINARYLDHFGVNGERHAA